MSDRPKDDLAKNELGGATSSYLLSAAHQPVQWRMWSNEVFESARREDKPILLDIGAVWCHWCHVMDRESYENAEVARVINENYVAVKVDRDERPDIDARYQMAVSALTGQGGWPLTAFLTSEGKPFYGGTYFPPEDHQGRPGMKRVLEAIAHNYRAHRQDILESAEKISAALGSAEKFEANGARAGVSLAGAIIENIHRQFDPYFGGFGSQPKFPHPTALDLMIDAYLETREAWVLNVITTTLDTMGRGGVYDQIGGGFHRYSVDERWIVPHFEKMSYDNAGLLGNYLRAYQATGREFYREIAEGILSFVEQVLSHPEGGFYASQDADINLDDDGDYFTWTLEEVKAVLGEREAALVARYYHIERQGEMHHNPAKNVLFIDQRIDGLALELKMSAEEVRQTLAAARAKLLEARSRRPTPFVDTTIYSSWNGMMISALLDAYRILGNEGARDRALSTLDLLLAQAYDPARGFAHCISRVPKTESASTPGPRFDFRVSNFDMLEDQAFMAAALIDAFEVTGSRAYFDRALAVADAAVRRFWDDSAGGFFDTAKESSERQGALTLARKPFQDSPTPSGNSVGAAVLDRLAYLADRPDLRDRAEAILNLFSSKAADYGLYAASFGLALVRHFRPSVDVVVVGPAGDERTRALLRSAHQAPKAGKHVLYFAPDGLEASSLPAGLSATLPHLAHLGMEGDPIALVCVGTACRPPVSTPEALAEALK